MSDTYDEMLARIVELGAVGGNHTFAPDEQDVILPLGDSLRLRQMSRLSALAGRWYVEERLGDGEGYWSFDRMTEGCDLGSRGRNTALEALAAWTGRRPGE